MYFTSGIDVKRHSDTFLIMKRAAIYARQSLDRTGEALAVTRQLEDCRKLITDKSWQPCGEYVDNDVSASSGKPRPQYRRLLADMAAGRIDAVVAWSADRLTRRPIEVEHLIDLVETHNVKLATVSGEVDLSTAYGRAIARIFGAIARQEVEQKGARQKRANLQRAQQGHAPWTRRPFGYVDDDGKIKVVAAEAREIKKAAKSILAGATLASVTADLNARGVTTSTGSAWSVTTTKRVLVNPRHAGKVTYNGVEVADGSWRPILDEDTHRAVVATLTDPRRRTAPASTAHKYLLSGLAICGRCGDTTKVFASPMGVKDDYRMVYRCRTAHLARNMQAVDEVVVGTILARLAMPDAAALLTEDVDVSGLRADADALRGKLDELAGLLADGVLTAAGVRETSQRLRAELDVIERDIAAASRSDDAAQLLNAPDVAARWATLPLRSRRAIVDMLVTVTLLPSGKGVRFDPEHVRIEWRAS